ncbi:MAG TPA: cupin domain-containing protein [Gemmataceae bacterium]|nr:cupin domain-containing protein [Gemmataceae bacterium]
MPKLIEKPTRIDAPGEKPIEIDEFVGRVNSGDAAVSIAYLRCPGGWIEPGQTPAFDEYTVVLKGVLRVAHSGGAIDARAGQAIVTQRGEWVQYSTPGDEGAEYLAVCLPAFSLAAAHRDEV